MPFIKTPSMHGQIFCIEVEEFLSELGVESQKNKTLPPDTIIVNCIGALAGSVSIADALRLRVKSRLADAGTLSLLEGLQLFEGGRKLLVSAACSAVMPQAFYPRKSLKGVDEFIKRCQVGQTAIGSYVASILCPPLAPAIPTLFDEMDEAPPFERKVTQSLMHGLRVLNDSVQLGDPLLIAGKRSQVDDESASPSMTVINFEIIDDQMADILRRKTDIQRLRSVDSFWRSARAILRAAILAEHSDWDRAMVNKEIARRISNGVVQDA